MFDLGFIKDIRFLLRRMPARTERQTMLFSATLSHRVLELAYEHMNEPEKIVVESEYITNSKVRQRMYLPADEEKLPLLLGLLSRTEGSRTMVFVNTKAFVERVARALERAGYRVGVLSGDVPQKKRESLLKKFQAGQLEILVATDVAARGLHIDGVSHVYNYDLPFDAEDYVHRIGRTARLGAEGDAISFACERYAISLPDIEAYIEQKIPVEPVSPDLLVALPRKPREVVPGAADDNDDGDSVSQIFREAREARAAEEQRRGGGRSGGHGTGGRSGSGGSRERQPRKPRAAGIAASAAPTSMPAPAPTPAGVAAAPAAAQGEHAPRKRRRRRGGKRIEGADAVQQRSGSGQEVTTPRGSGRHPAPAPKPQAGGTGEPSLLSRIGRGLKSLVTRAPRSQH
jgi:ATP-dependent RNA helicase RhlB